MNINNTGTMNIILKMIEIKKIYKSIFFIASFILSLLLVFSSLDFNEFLNNKEIYSCNLNQNIDYNVKIFPNSVFDKTVLPSNTMYISKLVDDINVQYNYKHSSAVDGNLKLLYTVKATTLIVENSEKTAEKISEVPAIRKKEHILKDKEEIKSDDNKNAFKSDNIVVDYDTYVKEVEEFKKDIYRLSYSVLLLDFEVDAVKQIENESDISVVSTGNVKIPLDEDSFLITTNFESNEQKKYMRYDNPQIYINYILLTSGCVLLVLDFILFYLNKKYYYIYHLKSPQYVKLKKFLSEFNEVIFKPEEKPDFTNKNQVFLSTFSELSNLYYLIKEPIIYYKNTLQENIITNYFFVNHHNTVYVFIFKTRK